LRSSRSGICFLVGNESTSFKITFAPSVVGIFWAAVHIDSNDPDNASFDIVLTGKCTSATASKAALPSPTATVGPAPAPSRPVISTILVNGTKYRCITIEKAARLAVSPGDVEVSSDLVHWFSGARYTTVLENNASVLRVRDNTPLTSATKRFIRFRKRG
jgi:hypothetical protein